MNKEKFTQGEWVVRDNEIGVRDESDSQSYGMMLTICSVDRYDFKDDWQTNARLISAAPDMYRTLQSVRGFIGDLVDRDEQGWLWMQEECDKIENVLAKARGET